MALWFRPARPPAGAEGGSGATGPAALAPDFWAAKAAPGLVPADCLGLAVAGNGTLLGVAKVGQSLALPRKGPAGQLWWLRTEAWTFHFAPHPTLAPEAGLAVRIAPQLVGGVGVDELARFLADQAAPLDQLYWARALGGCDMLYRLPPCVLPEVLAEAALDLQQWATAVGYPVEVLSLARVDVPADAAASDIADTSGAPGSTQAPSAAVPEHDPASGQAPKAQAPARFPTGAGDADARMRTADWTEVLAQDTRVSLALQRILPRLEPLLAGRWAGGGWAPGGNTYALQARTSQQLGLMAAKTGRLAPLGQGLRANPQAVPLLQRRLVAAAGLRAAQALAAIERAIGQLPVATVPEEATLHALAALVDQASDDLDLRLNAFEGLNHVD